MADLESVDPVLVAIRADACLSADKEGWEAPWYVGKKAMLAEARNVCKEQNAAAKKRLDDYEFYLDKNYAEIAQKQVAEDLRNQIGKKGKSVAYLTGRAGWKRQPAMMDVKIIDADAAVRALKEEAPSVLDTVISMARLKEYIKQSGVEVDGVKVTDIPARDTFHPKPIFKILENDNENK